MTATGWYQWSNLFLLLLAALVVALVAFGFVDNVRWVHVTAWASLGALAGALACLFKGQAVARRRVK